MGVGSVFRMSTKRRGLHGAERERPVERSLPGRVELGHQSSRYGLQQKASEPGVDQLRSFELVLPLAAASGPCAGPGALWDSRRR